MGHPIAPDDPANGGCPNCIVYVPNQLAATYFRFGFTTYNGFLRAIPPGLHTWQGVLVSHIPTFIRITIKFCRLPLGALHVVAQGWTTFDILDAHCTFPISGGAPNGDVLTVWVED